MKDLTGLEYLGKICFEKEQWLDAKSAFEKYRDWLQSQNLLTPEEASYLSCQIACCSVKLKDFLKAQEEYIKAISYNPERREPYIELGLIYERLNLYTEEINLLEKALKVTKKQEDNEKYQGIDLLNHLSFAYFNSGDFIKSMGYLTLASLQFPEYNFNNEIGMCRKYWEERGGNQNDPLFNM